MSEEFMNDYEFEKTLDDAVKPEDQLRILKLLARESRRTTKVIHSLPCKMDDSCPTVGPSKKQQFSTAAAGGGIVAVLLVIAEIILNLVSHGKLP